MKQQGGDNAFLGKTPYGTHHEATYAGALSFMRRPYTRDLDGIDVAVTGIPFDLATTNRPGARLGPRGVRQASAQLAWGPLWPWDFDPFDVLAVVDYGDCQFDFGEPQNVPKQIEAHAKEIIDTGTSLLSIGGDHFIAYPLLRAHAEKHGPLALVHFDAHSDTWREDDDRIDHGTMFFHAAQQGIVDPAKSVQTGIRTTNPETHGYTVLDAGFVHRNGTDAVTAEIRRVVGDSPAYLTFDIDCLDPSCAPGTGTPVVGGLTTWQAQEILRGLGDIDFVAMDLVEVAPIYDIGEITALAGATLALEYLCLRAARKSARE